MTEKLYESELKRLKLEFQEKFESVTGIDRELYINCLHYNLTNFSRIDSKRLHYAKSGSDQEKRLWKLWNEKENDMIWLWWDKVWDSNSHKSGRRVCAKWYGANGGVVCTFGDTPSKTELYYFGCTPYSEAGKCELNIHKRLGNCYNEYICSECGNGMRVDSSG